ncbi:hypothetical protein D3C80_1309510 [compost metagenome]
MFLLAHCRRARSRTPISTTNDRSSWAIYCWQWPNSAKSGAAGVSPRSATTRVSGWQSPHRLRGVRDRSAFGASSTHQWFARGDVVRQRAESLIEPILGSGLLRQRPTDKCGGTADASENFSPSCTEPLGWCLVRVRTSAGISVGNQDPLRTIFLILVHRIIGNELHSPTRTGW